MRLLLTLLMLQLLLLPANSEHVWVVQVDEGHATAESVAASHELENHGQVPHLNNKFVFKLSRSSSRSDQADPLHLSIHRSLAAHPKVSWLSYQTEVRRAKRDFIEAPRSISWDPRAVSDYSEQELEAAASSIFEDPLWRQQWYLHDTRGGGGAQPKADLHLLPVWRSNITGRGIVVAVVDDGLEWRHPDLRQNYEPAASYDFNQDDSDPSPTYTNVDEQRHGTRCAGEIAMVANNSHCGVGIAFEAKVGGVKILDGRMSDLLEARGLTHALDKVHVYSSSWGPTDDGRSLDGPGPLAAEALEVGVRRGRGGLGAIFVWASGNGGFVGDNCNCDGYAASVYTLAVSSASQRLLPPWYSEACSATLATTFSSGGRSDSGIVTTDLRHNCTNEFSGTSASAPAAAAIVALALQHNPQLTWRCVQHAVMWTAEVAPLRQNRGWRENAAGHQYHHRFGFGLFNVAQLVELVRPGHWRRVPEKRVATVDSWQCNRSWQLSHSASISCQVDVDDSVGLRYLEHVELKVKLRYSVRGALAVRIVSAQGSFSRLLTARSHDTSDAGLDWTLMTVHFWGERPTGTWQLLVEDKSATASNSGRLESLRLLLHGTQEMPHHRRLAGGSRTYSEDYNSLKNARRTDGSSSGAE